MGVPSNVDPTRAALQAGVDQILAQVRELAVGNPVILIDGRSGAGKTTLAEMLVQRWPYRVAPQVVGLDAVYPGWDGLDAGVREAHDKILVPHARSEVSVWTSWDWAADAPGEHSGMNPALALIVEGSGILTPDTAPLADVRVWIEAPEQTRYARAIARDGEMYRPNWDRWAAQEAVHVERDNPQALATVTIRLPELLGGAQ